MSENTPEKKKYYAFYSETAQKKSKMHEYDSNKYTSNTFIYKLEKDNIEIKCHAVYQCENYSSPEEVLEKHYKFPDAIFVGIVDTYVRTVY